MNYQEFTKDLLAIMPKIPETGASAWVQHPEHKKIYFATAVHKVEDQEDGYRTDLYVRIAHDCCGGEVVSREFQDVSEIPGLLAELEPIAIQQNHETH